MSEAPYQQPKGAAKTPRDRSRALGTYLLACVLLSIAVLAVYGQTLGFGFTNYDDPEYVTENAPVRDGLTRASWRWAWTTTHQANWHPLTWLSLMFDAELGGAGARAFHRTNVALHLLATLVLFATLDRMTRARVRSALVAALFAVHPLHVESVAWIAERKDVLSTAFWFAALFAWCSYVERKSRRGYALALAAFVAGLLSKPMLVTLPCTLLLLDAWPLGRITLDREGLARRLAPLVREKLPFFFISVVSCVVTVYAQHAGGAIGTFEKYPLWARFANATIAYAAYLRDVVWPRGLAALYPHPGTRVSLTAAALALVVLLAISVHAYRARIARPHLAVGWMWYVGTLIPVIGVVQVGLQARADRYTYVPLVGIFVMLAWSIPRLTPVVSTAAGVVTIALAMLAHAQAGFWKDGITLFSRAVAVTADNAVARNNLGSAYYRRDSPGDVERSVTHYAEAVRINPEYAVAFNNLAGSLQRVGRTDEAIARWQDAIRIKPRYVDARCNLSGALFHTGQLDSAAESALQALRFDAGATCAHYNLGLIRLKQGRVAEAEAELGAAVRLDPQDVSARLNRGVALAKLERLSEAVAEFEAVLRIDPGNEMARHNLARARAR